MACCTFAAAFHLGAIACPGRTMIIHNTQCFFRGTAGPFTFDSMIPFPVSRQYPGFCLASLSWLWPRKRLAQPHQTPSPNLNSRTAGTARNTAGRASHVPHSARGTRTFQSRALAAQYSVQHLVPSPHCPGKRVVFTPLGTPPRSTPGSMRDARKQA